MKIRTLNIAFLLVFFTLLMVQCKKENKDSNVEFNFITDSKYTYENKTINPGDSIIFNCTISSSLSMDSVSLSMNTTSQGGWPISSSAKNNFNFGDTIRNYKAGVYSFHFIVYDSLKNVLARKVITITISSDINYYTNRNLYVPDTTAKTNQCYLTLATGETFSYAGIGINTGLVDLGYYYGTTAKHTLYSPSNNQVAMYDFSTWPSLNITYLKKLSGVTFANILSGFDILNACGDIGTATKIENISVSNVIGFKTAAGKYGILFFKNKTADSGKSTTFCSVEIKIQK